jgi:signal transduction histidine kinase
MTEPPRNSPELSADAADSRTLLERLQRSADVLENLSGARAPELSEGTSAALRQEAAALRRMRGELGLLLKSWSLLTDTSQKLLNLPPDELESGVRAALEVLGRNIDAQRGYVTLLSDDGEHLSEAYEWFSPGMKAHGLAQHRGRSLVGFPWSLDELRAGRMVTVTDAGRLPPESVEEKRVCALLGVRSYITAPLLLAGRLLGWMGFDSVDAAREWTPEERHLMRLTAHVVVSAVDRKRRDAQLLQEKEREQRAQSLGILAAGLAHEINNPLAYATGNLEYLRERLPDVSEPTDAECLQVLDEALEGTLRIQRIVADLKALSSTQVEATEPVDLKAVTESTLRMAANQLRHKAQVVRDYGEDEPRVRGTSTKLGQVLLNLVLNAAHAIPEGHVSEHRITVSLRTDATEVRLAVSDTGCGIAPDVLPRIFDPLFTTRRAGEGMGMGLAICRDIVTALGGRIDVRSEPGRGTTVEVTLPRAEAPVPLAPSLQSLARSEGRRVLVVDDEPRVLDLMRRLLRGHELVTVPDGRAALARLSGDSAFDVILCDLMMPELTGVDVYQAVRDAWPGLHERIVFISGGAFTPETKRFLQEVKNPVLAKPFDARHLRDAVMAVALPPRD